MKLEKKTTVTLLIAIFMVSIFTVAFPVIAQDVAPPLYWVKVSVGGEFIDFSPGQYRCTIGLTGMSLSAVKIGATTAYKGSGVFVDHDQKMVIHLDITDGSLESYPMTKVRLSGTARVKDLDLKDKWTGEFTLWLSEDPDWELNRFHLYVANVNEPESFIWSGLVGGAGEANIWIWE